MLGQVVTTRTSSTVDFVDYSTIGEPVRRKRQPAPAATKKKHFAQCCSKKLSQRTTAKSVRGVELKQDSFDYNSEEKCKEVESLYIEAVTSSNKKCIEQELIVGNKPVIFKLDTGAECNKLPEIVAN